MTTNDQPVDIKKLKAEYDDHEQVARAFCLELEKQFEKIMSDNDINLGVPIESRVKDWFSISGKTERKSIQIQNIHEITDLHGLRLILLFQRDVDKVDKLLSNTFEVVERDNTQERQKTTEFGYQSVHYLIKLPDSWLEPPTMRRFKNLTAEIQVRTVAQHIWAAASHVLQYKQEAGVPESVRRSIHRVAALLEVVDLEFERVLEEREAYREDEYGVYLNSPDTVLNVDILEHILDSELPPNNKVPNESYAELLEDLSRASITTLGDLNDLFCEHLEAALEQEEYALIHQCRIPRPKHAVYFTHTALVRVAIDQIR
jgi:GTP pyrophosphokinase